MPTSQQMMQVLTPALETNNIMTNVRTLLGPATIGAVNPVASALAAVSLNDADNAIGWVFNVPKDGSVTEIGALISGKTGTPPAYYWGLVAPGTDGRPTTSPYGGSAITSYTPTATGFTWIPLDTQAAAVAGDYAAVYIYPTASTPNGSNFIAASATAGVAQGRGILMYYTTSWTVPSTGAGPIAVKYDDGEIYGMALSSLTVHVLIRSSTTPDEVGCLLTVPAGMTCYGARFFVAAASYGTSATADIILYDVNDTVLATTSISDKDFVNALGQVDVFWDGVNLTPGTSYRIAIKATTGTSGDIYTQKWSFESTTALASLPCGDSWQWTERTDGGVWTDTDTAVSPMALWISAIEFTSAYGFSG